MIKELQRAVRRWVIEHLGIEVADNKYVRCSRFCEESLELLQSLDYPKEDIYKLIDYVYSRPVGEPFQEVGGVTITLNSLCSCTGVEIDIEDAGSIELERIWQPEVVAKIQSKQNSQLENSPLPGSPNTED